MSTSAVSIDIKDPVNRRLLSVSEDRIAGFLVDPFAAIAEQSELPVETVIERIRAMLSGGTIRRVRQTMMATNLAPGALVAWQVPADKLNAAFDWMFQHDPFSGHVVIRTADASTPGAQYRLWTTLKVPHPFDLEAHCRLLMERTGAEAFRLMSAKRLFALGVGHMRRKTIEPGDKSDEPGRVLDTVIADLTEEQWQVLEPLKREFTVDEITTEPWRARAKEAGVSYERFLEVARELNAKGVVGRFSTFLEHVKKLKNGEAVTRYNALFHWAVPVGQEIQAGREVGRFHCMTHAYWREGGEEFRNVNIMGVSHGTEKDRVLAHKAAIDAHLESVGIPVGYTNVFWGGRSEIKPSEISPMAYRAWLDEQGVDHAAMMRDGGAGETE